MSITLQEVDNEGRITLVLSSAGKAIGTPPHCGAWVWALGLEKRQQTLLGEIFIWAVMRPKRAVGLSNDRESAGEVT